MKIKNETLTKLFEAQIITLETIHDSLQVKQHINNYVRNTNKKYGKSFEKDELLPLEIKNIIIINTLGKLNLLNEQAYYLRLLKNANIDRAKQQKAEKFAEKSNLADKIVNYAKVAVAISNADSTADEIEVIDSLMCQENVPNREFFSYNGKFAWFAKQFDYLTTLYKEI